MALTLPGIQACNRNELPKYFSRSGPRCLPLKRAPGTGGLCAQSRCLGLPHARGTPAGEVVGKSQGTVPHRKAPLVSGSRLSMVPPMGCFRWGWRASVGRLLTPGGFLLCRSPRELPIQVVAGLQQQPRENGPEQHFSVVKSVPHPSYDCETMANDIMLLKLDRKVLWKKTHLIQLAAKAPAPGTRCSVAGWGISEQRGKPSPVLRELDVQVMDARMCNNSRYWRGEITKTMVCVEGVEKDSAPCKGDSGGPVVCGKKAKVAGVLSFVHKGCVDIFKPPVATAVFKYRMWIRKVLFWP